MNKSHTIESTSRATLARGLFLAAALLSFGLSVALYFSGEETEGIFVGLWVPSILALGAFIAPPRAQAAHTAEPEATAPAGDAR